MQLRSNAFADGGMVPRRLTCDGENLSPELHWSEPPAETRSFVVLCDDPDAPAGTWHHWAAYDIGADLASLAEGAVAPDGPHAFKQAMNDFGRPGYGGPCPPRRHGPHHYHFRLLALATDRLPVSQRPSCRDVEREARKHLIAEATLVGVYER